MKQAQPKAAKRATTRMPTKQPSPKSRSGNSSKCHHRFRALQALGVELVPAWVFDYHEGPIRLERWTPGPPIEKAEVERRARERRPFPPKTTRHRVEVELPDRPTPPAQLYATTAPRASAAGSAPAAGAVTTLRGSQRP